MDFEQENRNRLFRLEQKVDFLLRELNLLEKEADYAARPGPEPFLDEAVFLARSGNLIKAIKFYREKTGLGLREAKTIIEQHM